MGRTNQYSTDLARERVTHRRTQDKLIAALQRVAELEAAAGLKVYCKTCGKMLTQPGVLLLRIGVPDENGKFEGVKEHVCDQCEKAGG